MEKEDYASAASLQAELRGIETQPPRPWHNGTPSGGGGLAGLCMLAVSAAVAEGGEVKREAPLPPPPPTPWRR